MGLDPAKTDTTSVSLSFTVMSPLESGGSTDAGRAIIPDGGYLYVRMLGGPTADTPGFLGPYRVTSASSTVSITDIPAGQYDGMFLFYADRVVHNEEVTIKGVATTLGEIFSLPDTDFLAFVEGDEEYEVEIPTEPVDEELFYEPHPVDVLLAGRASIGMVESPRVVEGVANSFRMTMFPITPYWIPVWFTGIGNPMYLSDLLYTFDGTEYESFKGFVGIPVIQMIVSYMHPDYTGDVTLTFSNESETETMTVNSLSVYDAEGVRTAAPPGPYPVAMPAGQKYALSVPVPDSEFDEIFFYLDVSGGNPALTITLDQGGTEPVDPVDPLPEVDEITGTLDLAAYMSNFDTVDSVMFSTTAAVSLADLAAWDPESEAPPAGIVGGADLTQNPIAASVYDFTGVIYSDFSGSALYLIIVGEKYGQTVLYASTESYQVSAMSYLSPTLTPLLQYVVVYSQSNGLGLADYSGMPAQLTVMQGSTPVAQSISYVEYLTEGDLAEYYVAAMLLVDTNGEPVVLPAENEYEVLFKVTDSEFTQELYSNNGSLYLETATDAFISVVFDLP